MTLRVGEPDARAARVKDLDAQLAQRRPEYDRVRAKAHDLAYQRDLQTTLALVSQLLMGYRAGDSGEKAIYVLGRLQGAVAPFETDLDVVREFEVLRERRKRLETAPE